jgi:hypothetical protein
MSPSGSLVTLLEEGSSGVELPQVDRQECLPLTTFLNAGCSVASSCGAGVVGSTVPALMLGLQPVDEIMTAIPRNKTNKRIMMLSSRD